MDTQIAARRWPRNSEWQRMVVLPDGVSGHEPITDVDPLRVNDTAMLSLDAIVDTLIRLGCHHRSTVQAQVDPSPQAGNLPIPTM